MRQKRRSIFRIDRLERIGERLRVDGRLSRTGIQIYSDGVGGNRREYRPPEEVFSDSSLKSLRSIPITVQHPPSGMVTGDNFRRLSVGHVGDDVRQDDDGIHVMGSLWVMDAQTIKKIESKELTELSVGYWASLEEQAGTTPDGQKYDAIQRNIEGNHLALLKTGQARGGKTVRMILDDNGDEIFFAHENERWRDRMKVKIHIDGIDHEVEADSPAVAQAVEKERKLLTDRALEAEKSRDEILAKLESAIAERDQLKSKLDEATDPEVVAAIAQARAQLISDAKKLAPDIEISGTDNDIRKLALEKAGIKISLDSSDYIIARFESALESLNEKKNDSVSNLRRAIASPPQPEKTKTVHPGVHLDRGWRN
jgi:hypothetical protein